MGLHLGSSKKLKFIFDDKFYDLYIPLIVSSSPKINILFENSNLTFSDSGFFNCLYASAASSFDFVSLGNTYFVEWDNVIYECSVKDSVKLSAASGASTTQSIHLGDLQITHIVSSPVTYPENYIFTGEPFSIHPNGTIMTKEGQTHSVKIYTLN